MEQKKLSGQHHENGERTIAVSRRVTVAADAIDQMVIHAPGLLLSTDTVGTETFRLINYVNRTRHEVNGAGGVKVSLRENVVLTGNLLFRLNNAGVRSGIVPLLGLSYLF